MQDDVKNRFRDLARTCEARDIPAHTPFLTPEEQDLFLSMKQDFSGVRWILDGGYEAAERKMAVFLPTWQETADPVTWLRISPVNERFGEELTHRDYLGAAMSLGIERDRTGDILIDGKRAFMAVTEEISRYLCENLSSVRRTRVICEVTELPENLRLPEIREISGTVASVRLDALIGTAFRLSRGAASDTIKAGYAFIDGRQVLSPGESVRDGAVISVRHRGKFVYYGEEGQSKKGRTIVRLGLYV